MSDNRVFAGIDVGTTTTKTVIINADRGIRWGQGLQVMDAVTQANPWKMAIAGQPKALKSGGAAP